MIYYIKNMKSNTCKAQLTSILHDLEIDGKQLDLGVLEVNPAISDCKWPLLKNELNSIELDILIDKDVDLVNRIKAGVQKWLNEKDTFLKPKYSDYISGILNLNYTYLSNVFSKSEGITIEKYLILMRIKHVKDLLHHDQMSLSDIAFQLNFSSLAHLSAQFKKFTGLTPSFFAAQNNIHSQMKKETAMSLSE